MNIKKIIVLTLSIAVVGGASLTVYANQNNDVLTKNVVVTTQNPQVNKESIKGKMSDEKAVQIATEAMKNYMGIDASCFSGTSIERQENTYNKYLENEPAREKYQKEHPEEMASENKFLKEHPEKAKEYSAAVEKSKELIKHSDDRITVFFTRANNNKCTGDFVVIDETTGEILNVTSINDLHANSNWKIDDIKVKNAALDFLKRTGKTDDVDINSISIKNNNGALSGVDFKLKNQSSKIKGGAKISLEVSLQNYSVMHYENYSNTYNK